MAYTSLGFVATHGANGTTNTTPTGNTTAATGNGLYVIAVGEGNPGGATSPTITDTYSNTWTQIGSIFQAGASPLYISRYYCQNANGGANHEVTATFGTAPSGGSYVCFAQILNPSLTAFYVASNQANYLSSTANPFSSGTLTVTPPLSGTMLLSSLTFALSTASGGTITEANGFTLATMASTAFSANVQLGSLVETSSSTYNASWSSTEAAMYATPFIAAIDAFAGSPPPILPPVMYHRTNRLFFI
jgi:hypothetical protein